MTFLIQLCGRILIAVLGNSALTNQILQALGVPAQQDTALAIATDAAITRAVVDWSEVSPGPLKTALIALEADLTSQTTAILNAIALLQLAADPVILPTTPPTGYGGGGGGTTAADIWAYPDPNGAGAAIDLLSEAGVFTRRMSDWMAVPLAGNPVFSVRASWGFILNDLGEHPDLIALDWSTILTVDTPLTWLTRVAPDYDWAVNADSGLVEAPSIYAPGTDCIVTFNLSKNQFDKVKTFVSVRDVPPVWPGLSGVTLLGPTAISTAFTIGVPMDGVIVELTSVPERYSFYDFDGIKSWRNIGQLAFYDNDDNTSFEHAQSLGFRFAVYTPKVMNRATGVSFRTVGGIEGTVTPWLILE
jgi:hypothetical protein